MTRVGGDWLDNPGTRAVMSALTGAGHQALFVGGCVRDALLGRPVSDVDIATDARPEAVTRIAEQAGLKAVPTGFAHGTVTVISGGTAHEVTTFRKDVETFGRHATVAFSDDLHDDARRRDFTMNALYARADGTVVDPLGGLDDLRAGRVRFIDDPARRIEEDYLRILRFFRFFAWYGDPSAGMDPHALAAIAAHLDGLDRLSAERTGAEMKRLLAAPDPAPAAATMAQAGVLAHVLPGADARPLAPLVRAEGATPPDPIRRLAAIGGEDAARRLRLSRVETRRLTLLRGLLAGGAPQAEIAYRHGAQAAIDTALLRAATGGPAPEPGFAEAAQQAAARRFPLRAADLKGRAQGPALGQMLKDLEQRWIDSGFSLSREELLRMAG